MNQTNWVFVRPWWRPEVDARCIMWRLWLWFVCGCECVCVCKGQRQRNRELSFVVSPQGHWPVKNVPVTLEPWNHDSHHLFKHRRKASERNPSSWTSLNLQECSRTSVWGSETADHAGPHGGSYSRILRGQRSEMDWTERWQERSKERGSEKEETNTGERSQQRKDRSRKKRWAA